jgi:hypothetical protein
MSLSRTLRQKFPFLRYSFLRAAFGGMNVIRTGQMGDGREEATADYVIANAPAGADHVREPTLVPASPYPPRGNYCHATVLDTSTATTGPGPRRVEHYGPCGSKSAVNAVAIALEGRITPARNNSPCQADRPLTSQARLQSGPLQGGVEDNLDGLGGTPPGYPVLLG